MRRRRRRSAFAQNGSPIGLIAVAGVAGVVLIGGFFFFLSQADQLAPEPAEISVQLPDAFKE